MNLRPVSTRALLVLLSVGATHVLQGCAAEIGRGGQLAPDRLKGSQLNQSDSSHGTCVGPPQKPLRWGADYKEANEVACLDHHSAEFPGTWERTELPAEIASQSSLDNCTITFYDSVTGKPLFEAPKGRSWADFLRECTIHGWPSFRDEEVVSDNVRVLADGKVVSSSGTRLGSNEPNYKGNRYSINLVSIAGNPQP